MSRTMDWAKGKSVASRADVFADLPAFLPLTLFIRGLMMLALALIAVRWPEGMLLLAIGVTGVLLLGFAIVDVATAIAVRHGPGRAAWAIAALALLSAAFGALTLAIPGLERTLMLDCVALWLVLVGSAAIILATLLPTGARLGGVSAAWGLLHMVLGVLMLASPNWDAMTLLYAGAAYTAGLGASLVGLAVWLRRHRAAPPRAPDTASLAG